jgi:hypothetical protein
MQVRKAVALGAAVIAAALAGCGGSSDGGPHYTYWSNPCVTSRIANGDWQQQEMARGVALDGAAMYCSYGASFDNVSDPGYGIGPNTSGWDWRGKIPDMPSVAPLLPAQATATPSTSPGRASIPTWTPSANPYSKGCPTSGELLAAWNAAPVSARTSWTTLTATGFFGTECWHPWVVTNPVMQGNGPVVFTDNGGQLSLLPETELSKLDAAICGVAGAPSAYWAGPGGPATCSKSG